ncbi:hypothetical protein HYH02_008588 [Chlamydomonas schloesseri]|uniref:Uncharacterized protein n=1 Tax=Chlamydomonas schloesseri TaxID=2026947 RepID=A0A836B3U7_9CHLO|nr:hypothetical protein HYH02_008588 [Chlamydomonas schloesseri]|eukprot:KAG2446603.1 hypothetical protein HYH02_008588 [Chlamydomonas schloesseri]
MGNLCAGGVEELPSDPVERALAIAKRDLAKGSGKWQKQFSYDKVLGRGAYAQVVRATRKATQKQYATKIIKKGQYDRQVVLKEIAISNILSEHPNCTKLVEVFEDGANYYLVMELISGGMMFDRIVKKGHYSEKEAAKAMAVLLDFVSFMHSKGIVDRDLKPDNILLSDDTDSAAIKMIDFGTGEFVKEGQMLTQNVGTAQYMAPEVFKGKYDQRADIWSLGVIMYILLVGFMPFGGKNDAAIEKAVLKGKYPLEGEEWDEVSDEAKDMVRAMLQPDPDKRAPLQQLQAHPWFAAAVTMSPCAARGTRMVSHLRAFLSSTRLKRLAMLVVASNMKADEVDQLRELFVAADTNKNNLIDFEELRAALTKLGRAVDDAELRRLFDAADVDGSGELDYREFVAALVGQDVVERCSTARRGAFKEIDTDGDGYLTPEEVLRMMPPGSTLEEAREMVKAADVDGDGRLDLNELELILQQQHG